MLVIIITFNSLKSELNNLMFCRCYFLSIFLKYIFSVILMETSMKFVAKGSIDKSGLVKSYSFASNLVPDITLTNDDTVY